jgi:hypothetical protein
MTREQIELIVAKIDAIGSYVDDDVPDGLPEPLIRRCISFPYLIWDKIFLEYELHVVLPSNLVDLWNTASCLSLFVDSTYGQSGFVIWSPDQALVRHRRYASERSDDFLAGDFIIGEFLGDSDLLVLRCDPRADDYGALMVALPLDEREDWYRPAATLDEFLLRVLETRGDKYWEAH